MAFLFDLARFGHEAFRRGRIRGIMHAYGVITLLMASTMLEALLTWSMDLAALYYSIIQF